MKSFDQTSWIYFLVQFRCQNPNQHHKIPSKRYQYHAHRKNEKLCSGAIVLPFDIFCSSCSILCSCSRVNNNKLECLAGILWASRACYAPRGHAMRLAGMVCAPLACYAPSGHGMRLTGVLCASRACYAPNGHAMRLADMVWASLACWHVALVTCYNYQKQKSYHDNNRRVLRVGAPLRCQRVL